MSDTSTTPHDAADNRVPWPHGLSGVVFGGDYNPEQWPEDVWPEDVRLMREAGVTMVSVGIFSWAMLEPQPGVFSFGWLDRVLDLLHENGIAVDLATPTAGPPAWLYEAHPEAWVVDGAGVRRGPGSRGMMCPSSPAYAEAAAGITAGLGDRYAAHPAVVMWHVHNEYGAPVLECHCETSTRAFRTWLTNRYGDVAAVNEAWGTAFWGQRYSRMAEIHTPAASSSVLNPAQKLDYARFCDDALRQCFVRERDILHAQEPRLPVTTNFMATSCPGLDYWKWAREVDLVSNDHYLTGERHDAHVMLAMDADLTRSLAGGRPWLLMEHSTSAVNWQPRNIAKRPGEMRRNSLGHIARGADGVLFFQWRAARSGAEKFHSAMLPHGGTDTRVWREVVGLGAEVGRLGEVHGSRTRSEVAVLWDWESFWAQSQEWRPSDDLDPRERVEAFYAQLWADGLTADFVHPQDDLSSYRLVVAPQLYLVTAQAAKNLDDYVRSGGVLLVSYFTGVVDEFDAVHADGLSGPLGATLGLRVEEFTPLRAGDDVRVSWADDSSGEADRADVWSEQVVVSPGTEVLAVFDDGPVPGAPAVTRHEVGGGRAWYVATRFEAAALAGLLRRVYRDAELADVVGRTPGLEVVRRESASASWLFALNHTAVDATVEASGMDVLGGERVQGSVQVAAGDVVVVRLE